MRKRIGLVGLLLFELLLVLEVALKLHGAVVIDETVDTPHYGIRCVSECRVSGEVLGSVCDSPISRVFIHCNLLLEGLFSLYAM